MASADNLILNLEGLDAASFANEFERTRARDALTRALAKVQSPWDIVWQHNWVNGATNACIKTLIDVGLFTKWAEQGHTPKTSAEFAKFTGADEQLLRRLLRQIAGQNLIVETAEDTFAPTQWARTIAADPALASTYGKFYSDLNNPMFVNLPSFLKVTGYRNPTDAKKSNWQHLRGSDISYFASVGADPTVTHDFNDAMQSHSRYNLSSWTDIYPTETVVPAAKPGRALVVDVGGGKGHDLEKFSSRHPDIPAGSLVLQDLPEILKNVKPAPSISLHVHDFFTPEPVKGARVYLLHNVLHDWEEAQAITILKQVTEAMEKGYSRLLIHESLVSSFRPHPRVAVSDITMMACLSSKERTENEFRSMIEKASLKVIKIWRPPQSVESIIEAEAA